MRSHYSKLHVPIAQLAGKAHKVVSPQQSMRLHALLPQARLHLLDGVGHMAHYAGAQIVAGVEHALAQAAAQPA